jgi:hypothetical protein
MDAHGQPPVPVLTDPTTDREDEPMNSTTALHLARARQDDLLRSAIRRPRRDPAARDAGRTGRRYDLLRWFPFPRLASSRP